jgi:hypothetical protein
MWTQEVGLHLHPVLLVDERVTLLLGWIYILAIFMFIQVFVVALQGLLSPAFFLPQRVRISQLIDRPYLHMRDYVVRCKKNIRLPSAYACRGPRVPGTKFGRLCYLHGCHPCWEGEE